MVATAGHEMQMAIPLVVMQAFGHQI